MTQDMNNLRLKPKTTRVAIRLDNAPGTEP